MQLELEDFKDAVESFTRTVQLEADDAEAWSNLAAALLRLPEAEPGDEDLPKPLLSESAVEDIDKLSATPREHETSAPPPQTPQRRPLRPPPCRPAQTL